MLVPRFTRFFVKNDTKQIYAQKLHHNICIIQTTGKVKNQQNNVKQKKSVGVRTCDSDSSLKHVLRVQHSALPRENKNNTNI